MNKIAILLLFILNINAQGYGSYDYDTGTFSKDSISTNGTDLVLIYDFCKDPNYD